LNVHTERSFCGPPLGLVIVEVVGEGGREGWASSNKRRNGQEGREGKAKRMDYAVT
jgi:hypothetical protein